MYDFLGHVPPTRCAVSDKNDVSSRQTSSVVLLFDKFDREKTISWSDGPLMADGLGILTTDESANTMNTRDGLTKVDDCTYSSLVEEMAVQEAGTLTTVQSGPSLSSPTSSPELPPCGGSGLQDSNYHVLTPDKQIMVSIPPEYVEPTNGSRNYRARNKGKPLFSFCLCKVHSAGKQCSHRSNCDFIHCKLEKLPYLAQCKRSENSMPDAAPQPENPVKVFQVHWSKPIKSLDEAPYPRLEPGRTISIQGYEPAARGMNSTNGIANIPSEMVYRTAGALDCLQSSCALPLRHCKHYAREKCARGELCHFIHVVRLINSPKIASQQADHDSPSSHINASSNHYGSAAPTQPPTHHFMVHSPNIMPPGMAPYAGSCAPPCAFPQRFSLVPGIPSVPAILSHGGYALPAAQTRAAVPPYENSGMVHFNRTAMVPAYSLTPTYYSACAKNINNFVGGNDLSCNGVLLSPSVAHGDSNVQQQKPFIYPYMGSE